MVSLVEEGSAERSDLPDVVRPTSPPIRQPLMAPRLLSLVALGVGLCSSGCAQSGEDSMSWNAVESLVERDFPEVAVISTDSLAAWLADSTRRPPLLLDAREAEEYAVSHLPGAVRVPPDLSADSLAAALNDQPDARERPVVVYCSVGYRSAGVAERLGEAGFRDVQNLEGSIFRWANEGRAVVRNGATVSEVHPYNAVWGRLLDGTLHAR